MSVLGAILGFGGSYDWGDDYCQAQTQTNLANYRGLAQMQNMQRAPKFRPHQMTDLEAERFNRAGLLRRA